MMSDYALPNQELMGEEDWLIYCCAWVVLRSTDSDVLDEYEIACRGGIVWW